MGSEKFSELFGVFIEEFLGALSSSSRSCAKNIKIKNRNLSK
jgi:hypothetical protein